MLKFQILWRVDPGQKISAHQPPIHTTSKLGEENLNHRSKEKLMGWDKAILRSEGKKEGKNTQVKQRQSLPPTSIPELKQPPSNHFRKTSLQFLTFYGREYPFGQFGSLVPAVFPPKLLHIPPAYLPQAESEKAFLLCRCCSAIGKTQVCYQHRFSH